MNPYIDRMRSGVAFTYVIAWDKEGTMRRSKVFTFPFGDGVNLNINTDYSAPSSQPTPIPEPTYLVTTCLLSVLGYWYKHRTSNTSDRSLLTDPPVAGSRQTSSAELQLCVLVLGDAPVDDPFGLCWVGELVCAPASGSI
jgi:hypothetical protein